MASRDKPDLPASPPAPWFTDDDLHLFNEGTHACLYDRLGAHLVGGPTPGVRFGVWAPSAERVSVVGDFNDWQPRVHPMSPVGSSGIWEAFIPGLGAGEVYKYHVESREAGYRVDKTDPFGFRQEVPPRTGSIVHALDYDWSDDAWMAGRAERNSHHAPISIYEVHLGSWRHVPGESDRSLTYRELAPLLADHCLRHGFTHVELLPVMEHPLYKSWGYQTVGYFAPTSRYGDAQDFMFFVDTLHQAGVGVILDWVPSHFPSDEHGLGFFDGTHLFEHADPRQGFHPDWKSLIFNYGRNEVRSFLTSSAMFWLDKFHADGIRVDAVASMLYLDYSRKEGEWIPNPHGGRENLEAIDFLRRLNSEVYRLHPDVQMYAEESTAWPGVSRPTFTGGLGFGFKWDMGWMHDTLAYLGHEPVHRKYHHNQITFRAIYQFSENYVLPLSHDEVVHGKGSLLDRMPGDAWQKFANLRLLLANQWSQPGKKLLFMGGEFAQWDEWDHEKSLDWHLTEAPRHAGIGRMVTQLNRLYREEPALHELDESPEGFEWIDGADAEQSVLAILRKGEGGCDSGSVVLVVANYTPVPREGYRVGVPMGGEWLEILNTDAKEFGGSGVGNLGRVEAVEPGEHGRDHALELTLPPLSLVMLKPASGGHAGS